MVNGDMDCIVFTDKYSYTQGAIMAQKDVDKKGNIKPGEFVGQKVKVDEAELIKTSERNLKRAPDGKIKTTTQQLKKIR